MLVLFSERKKFPTKTNKDTNFFSVFGEYSAGPGFLTLFIVSLGDFGNFVLVVNYDVIIIITGLTESIFGLYCIPLGVSYR